MTKKWSQLVLVVVSVLAVAVSAGAIAASADDGDDGDRQRGFGRYGIVGTWQATVSRGPALPPLTSLHALTRSGTMTESGSDNVFRSPSYGVWEYVGNRTYATTMVFHRFGPTGVYLGTHRINANRRLSADGDSYVGVAVGELRDPDGNLIAALPPATITATRLQLVPIPNQP